MKLTMTISTPAAYFFNKVISSSLYDIEENTGQKISMGQMKDYSFRKKLSSGYESILTITEVILNQKYAYSMKTGRNMYHVNYEIKPIDDHSMTLDYSELLVGKNKQIDANNRLTSLLLGWSRKRRFKKMAREIEKSYQSFKEAV